MILTPSEAALLQRGEIESDMHVLGIVANAVVGFGLGQALQGRWLSDGGWRFTVGMAGGTALFFAAAGREGQNVGIELAAAATLLTFYVWGIVDAATGPQRHNNRIRDIKLRHGIPLAMPYVQHADSARTAGLVLRF